MNENKELTDRVGFRLPRSIREQIKALAEREGRSESNMMRRMVELQLEQELDAVLMRTRPHPRGEEKRPPA